MLLIGFREITKQFKKSLLWSISNTFVPSAFLPPFWKQKGPRKDHEAEDYYKTILRLVNRIRSSVLLNPIQTGLFLVLWDRGGGRIPPPPLNYKNIKAMWQRPKMFPLRSATSADGVIWRHHNVLFSNGGHLGSVILDFLNFPKTFKNRQHWLRSDQSQ